MQSWYMTQLHRLVFSGQLVIHTKKLKLIPIHKHNLQIQRRHKGERQNLKTFSRTQERMSLWPCSEKICSPNRVGKSNQNFSHKIEKAGQEPSFWKCQLQIVPMEGYTPNLKSSCLHRMGLWINFYNLLTLLYLAVLPKFPHRMYNTSK